MNITDIFSLEPFSVNFEDKTKILDSLLSGLTKHHYDKCHEYKRMLDSFGFNPRAVVNYAEQPFLPVRLFKTHNLYSINKDEISKTMTSSGTSGQQVSKIFIDKETSLNQTKALARIVSATIGSERSPMIILDSESVLKDRKMFSARGAGILGFSPFGTKRIYALKDDMSLDYEGISNFIDEHKEKKIFLFGFTFMIYQHFLLELQSRGLSLDLFDSVLIHGGGWKKLESKSISSNRLKEMLFDICGIKNVYDYYGMVEQTGSIFMECSAGNMHASIFSDVLVRNPLDFSLSEFGQKGIIQTVSVLPKSYPGHSLLTEDEGILLGVDDCECGKMGKYFKIVGRVKNAELRGCSDTYEG